MKVRLIGEDGLTVHAEGELDDKKAGECGALIRKGRFYIYRGMEGGVFTFGETRQPWDVTNDLKPKSRYVILGNRPTEEYRSESGHYVRGGPWIIYDNLLDQTHVTLFGGRSMLDAQKLCEVLNNEAR